MSWLRIDDGFDTHPKMLELTEQQRWRWTRVLIHCARHHTEGHVKASVLRDIGLARNVGELVTLGLLEENGTGYLVHDWVIYNGETIAEKVAAFLENAPDATANDVHKGIGGKRELVLREVARLRENTGSPPGTQVVPGNQEGTEKEPDGEPLLPVPDRYQSGSPAREPVPSFKDIHPRPLAKGPTSPVENPDADPDGDIDFNSPPIPQRTARG